MSEYEGKYNPRDRFHREIKVGMRLLYAIRHTTVQMHIIRVTSVEGAPDFALVEGDREGDNRHVKLGRIQNTIIIPEGW